MRTLLQDLRFGIRSLRHSKGFALIAVLSLALGIGATTATFSIIDALVLRPLDFNELDRIVSVVETLPQQDEGNRFVAPADYVDLKQQQTSFADMVAYRWASSNLTGGDEPERVMSFQVSTNFFQLVGREAELGRTFVAEEEQPGREQSAILSHNLWQRRFGSDPKIVGATIALNGHKFTVVGVMPDGFDFPRPAELWIPLSLTSEQWNERREQDLSVIARLKPGVSLSQANAELATLSKRLAEQHPQTNTGRVADAALLRDRINGKYNQIFIYFLFGAATFVLLLVCVNIANLQLARATARSKEIAVRATMGAGRGRLIRQLLTESVLLALLGGLAGITVSYWMLDWIRQSIPPDQIRFIEGWQSMSLNPQVMLFSLGITLLCGIVFGLAPALQFSRPDLNEALKEGGRNDAVGKHHLRSGLIAAEIALALVLLVGAGLMVKGFGQMVENQARGFRPENLLTLRTVLTESKYKEPHQVAEFYRNAVERLRRLPEVKSASVISTLPASDSWSTSEFQIEGQPAPLPGQERLTNFQNIGTQYFETIGIAIKQGREFTERDGRDAPRVAVISERFAQLYFPNENPLGKHVRPGNAAVNGEWFTIIGVVGDVRRFIFDRDLKPSLYLPQTQQSDRGMYFVLRTTSDPTKLIAAARAQIASLDPEQPLYEINSMERVIEVQLAGLRMAAGLMGMFGLMALFIAAIGVYGVMAYSVSQRTHEIGIRLALGAQPRDVIRMVTKQAMKLTALGVSVGFPLAFALSHAMEGAMFGLVSLDYLAIGSFVLLLVIVALLASWLPARRASRTDPMIVLRS